MQVPSVTLEDLQAFQAEHFPGHPPSLIAPAPEPDTEDDIEKDDLGYYPDGVKRTLTDEQIRIFRHSEIHALLRARQLQQEDAEYEARMGPSEDAEPTTEVATHKETPVVDATQKSERTTMKRKAQEDPYEGKTHRTFERETHDPGLQSLDYEETQPESAAPPKRGESHPSHPHRRIISYED